VYSADGWRFEVPLAYLGTAVFGELLSMAQEEFGFAGDDGRISLPCDAAVMEYIICLLRRDASEEVVRAFLMSSIVRSACPPHCQRRDAIDGAHVPVSCLCIATIDLLMCSTVGS
jgi:hypothetical protein